MQAHHNYNKRPSPAGYAVMLSVISLGILILGVMSMTYHRAVVDHEVAADTHLRMDYSQKEDAFLRALVQIVPEKAYLAMHEGSSDGDAFSEIKWPTIFQEALDAANAEISDDALMQAIDTTSTRANVGDVELVGEMMKSLVGYNPESNTGGISFEITGVSTPSMWSYRSGSQLSLDHEKLAPIISHEKGYVDENGNFSNYAVLPYPNIHFGYCEPGEDFVAKHNWWTFSVDFADQGEGTHVGSAVKHYMISLYEVPSQLPISADAFMSMGKHADESDWNANIIIDGGVYGRKVEQTNINSSVTRLATREGAELLSMSNIGNIGAESMTREDYENQHANIYHSDENFFPISRSSDSGRVSFIPINTGIDFFRYYGGDEHDESTTFSSTTWTEYSRGARQCELQVDILDVFPNMGSLEVDGIRVKAMKPDGTEWERYYLGAGHSLIGTGSQYQDWDAQDFENAFPFRPEEVAANGQGAITLDLSLLKVFLTANGLNVEDNNTIHVTHRLPSEAEEAANTFHNLEEYYEQPPADDDVALKITGASDLATDFSAGLSVVTDLRTFFDDDFNETTKSSGAYPAVSIFTPEPRFGSERVDLGIDMSGRLNVLANDYTESVKPLDLKSASGTSYSDAIEAELKPVETVDDLPPVHFVNWLIVVEEL